MITIRKRIYTSENTYADTFTRLGLDVEKVEELTDPFRASQTVDTNKRWVGIIEEEIGTFEVIKPNPTVIFPQRLLEGNFYNLYIFGKVFNEGSQCKIKLDFKLGARAAGVLVFTCLFPIIMAGGLIAQGRLAEIEYAAFLLLVMVTLGPALLIFQLSQTEEKINDSLGVRGQIRSVGRTK